MNLDNEYNIAARYRTIRKHLDSLGYGQALSVDALPLIEKLLSDLIQTTDSLKHFKTVAHDNVEAYSRLQLSIDPYKCDNSRLVQECNQLHLDLIEAKESHQKQVKDLKKKVYCLESECNDLQAASSRNLKRIKDLETESAQKGKRIQELLGKCNKPLVNNVALGSKKRPCYPLRRPTLDAEPMPRSRSNSALPSHSKIEPQVVDLVGMADRRINSLNREVSELKGELSLHIDSVYSLKAQLSTKEKEISRLRKMLEGGRPYSAVSKDCSCKKIGQCCDRGDCEKSSDLHCGCYKAADTGELRTLQKSKSDLEQQLREALDKQHDAMSQAMKLAERNEELEKELRDIDHIALAVEADCNSTVKENNKRVSQLQEKLESAMTQVHVLEGELMVERRSGQELRADLEGARLENRNLQRKLDSSLDEKKQMTDRINQLTVIEQSLNEEIGRLARTNGNLKQEVARLDCANGLLKKQMISNELARNDKEELRDVKEKGEKNDRNKGKMLMKKKPASRGQRRSYSPPIHEKQPETMRRQSQDARDDEVTRDSNVEPMRNGSERFNGGKDVKISQLRQTIDQVQTDRDFYKKEYNRLREQCVKSSEADNAELWSQVCDLRRQLIDKEHVVLDLQREKKELCREKFELELRLQSSRSERRNAGHPCCQCRPMGSCSCTVPVPLAGGDSKASSALVERLERERDMARADVDRLVEERDTLRERLKLAVETHKFEQHQLRESLCDVETRFKKLERERQDLLVAQGTQRATIDGFGDQLEDLREELRRTKQELSTQRTQYFQLRTLQDQADQALGDVQGQLNHAEGELYKAMDRNRLLEQQRMQLDNDVAQLKQEINTLRSHRNQTDQEKDQLVMELEDKTSRIAALEREIKSKEQEASGAEQQLQELQHKNQICVDQSAEQERRLRNMQMEMEIHQRQLAAASTDRDNAAQENRRLQDDLAAVTCEIRTLQRELEVSRAESYDLKRQLQTYVSEVRRAEELINKKENERTEMLNHFRSLSLEATMLENNNHSLESEAAEARGALQSAQDRSLDLERQLADRDCLIRGYETQISELTQTVASLETQIRQQMDQRQRAEADLNAVRDLCVKLDQQKETLVKELGDKDAMKAQYEAQLARLKTENSMVQDQSHRDHVTVERLESLLDQARQESMDSQTANQELQCEMSRLKQRTCELQNKLSAESAELRRYQNQAAEYSKQIAELRRQVTNERFDRARKEEEHRSNCMCGESGNLKRRENLASDLSKDASMTRRHDVNAANATGGPSARYPQSGKAEEARCGGGLRFEAQRTNRFRASAACKGSTITTCKCSAGNSKMYNGAKVGPVETDDRSINVTLNSDITARRTDDSRMQTSTTGEIVRHEQAHWPNLKCGGLCVRATLEEDNKHKNIRVRICDPNKDKAGNVTFCTPPVCTETSRRAQLADTTISDVRPTEDSSAVIAYALAPKIGETSSSNSENPPESIATDGRTVREGNEVQRASLSSKINQTLRSLNSMTDDNRNRADRDKITESLQLELSENNEPTPSTDDDTSGYQTSEAPKLQNSNYSNASDRRSNSIDGSQRQGQSSINETANDTLRILERMLKGRPKLAERRSRSVPRGRTDKEPEVKSNFSGPIRIDYRGATLTEADLTRPEFVQWLTEVKEKTQNVERQLARINRTMRGSKLTNDVSSSTNVQTLHDKNPKKCSESCKLAACTSHDVAAEKNRKTPKKTKDKASQTDLFAFPKMITSTSKSSNEIEVNNTGVAKIANGNKEQSVATTKSNGAVAERDKAVNTEKSIAKEPKDQNHISRNRIYIVGSEQSSGTQTHVTRARSPHLVVVDESTMFKPSKIHKLKNLATSKQTTPREKLLANETTSSRSQKSSSRTESPPASISGRSFIPKRQTSPEKHRSPPKRFYASLKADSSQPERPSTSGDSGRHCSVERDRWFSRFSQHRETSPPRSTEGRSRSLNSNRTVSVRDSFSVLTLRDTMDATGKSHGQLEVIEIERTRNTPKPFTFKMMKKSVKLENSEAGESRAVGTRRSCSRSSRDDSVEDETRKILIRKNRTDAPEVTRPGSRSARSQSSSPRRPLDHTIGRLFEHHTPGEEYVNDSSLANDERRPPRKSRSPANSSRNRDSERELSLTNYGSNNSRLERADLGTDDAWESANSHSAYNSDTKSKAQQTSNLSSR